MEISLKINPRQMLSLDALKKLEDLAASKDITFEELVSSTLNTLAALGDTQPQELQPMPVATEEGAGK